VSPALFLSKLVKFHYILQVTYRQYSDEIDVEVRSHKRYFNCRLLWLSVRDLNTSSLVSSHAQCVIHLPVRMRCACVESVGPETVPQRADNCVTNHEKHRDGRRCISDRVTSALNSGLPEDGDVLGKQRDKFFQHCRK